MKKFWIAFISFVIIFLVVLGFLWSMKAKIVAGILSRQLGTPVRIGSIELSKENITMTEFEIITPSDPVFPKAFTLDYLRISANYWDLLFRKAKQIDEIYLRDVFVGIHLYNAAGTQNNWSALLNNLQKGSKPSKDDTQMRFVIDQLFIQNATLALKRPNQSVQTFPPLNVKLTNIGSEHPASVTQIMKLLIAEVVRQLSLKYGLQKLFGELLNPKNWLKELGDTIKNFPRKLPFIGFLEAYFDKSKNSVKQPSYEESKPQPDWQ